MPDPVVWLRKFERSDLPTVEPWFHDPETQLYLGGPEWPRTMLDHGSRSVGQIFRGAQQTGAHRYLARTGARAVGYVDCGTFNRCTVYGGEGTDGPIVSEAIGVPTGSIAFVIDPSLRGRGLGRAMIAALFSLPELEHVELFEAGVEPDNTASRRCLEAVGFRLRCEQPDFEGMLYYRAWRRDPDG